MTAQLPTFSFKAALLRAEETLSKPPRWPHTRRVAPVGELVQRFALPLELCPTLNAFAEMPNWKRKKLKDSVGKLMLIQNGGRRRAKPLTGRPMVRAIRFSSVESDEDAAWMKFPVDRLRVKDGLGFIVDDKPASVHRVSWVEYAKRGEGCVVIEVWTGEAK